MNRLRGLIILQKQMIIGKYYVNHDKASWPPVNLWKSSSLRPLDPSLARVDMKM